MMDIMRAWYKQSVATAQDDRQNVRTFPPESVEARIIAKEITTEISFARNPKALSNARLSGKVRPT